MGGIPGGGILRAPSLAFPSLPAILEFQEARGKLRLATIEHLGNSACDTEQKVIIADFSFVNKN